MFERANIENTKPAHGILRSHQTHQETLLHTHGKRCVFFGEELFRPIFNLPSHSLPLWYSCLNAIQIVAPLQQKVQRATTCLIKSHVFPTSRSFNGNLSKLRPSLVWNFERSALISNYMCEGKHLLCWFWYLGWYRVAIWHKNNIRCNNWVHRNIVEIIVLSETCQESYWEGNWIGRRGVIERFQKLSNLREDHSSMLHMFYISVKIFV